MSRTFVFGNESSTSYAGSGLTRAYATKYQDLDTSAEVDELGVELELAGDIDIGIYRVVGTDILLRSTGTFSGSVGWNYAPITPLTLSNGTYWLAISLSSSAAVRYQLNSGITSEWNSDSPPLNSPWSGSSTNIQAVVAAYTNVVPKVSGKIFFMGSNF